MPALVDARSFGATNGVTNGYLNGHTNGDLNGHTQSVNAHTNGYVNGHSNENIATPTSSSEPIAICGMAMRLPGGIHDAEGFWDALYNGKDLRCPIPSDRYNAKAFSNALGKKGAIKTQYGYFLKDDLSCLDASFFSMTKAELERTDPQQRQILEVTRQCLESAGEVNYRGKSIGCFVGTFGEDWLHSQSKENQFTGAFSGSGDLMIANRVSYEFDLKGPRHVTP
jgi:acyl transferase domain-containing protein